MKNNCKKVLALSLLMTGAILSASVVSATRGGSLTNLASKPVDVVKKAFGRTCKFACNNKKSILAGVAVGAVVGVGYLAWKKMKCNTEQVEA